MKNLTALLFALTMSSTALAHGIAAGGGGSDTMPQISKDQQGQYVVECPGRGQVRCEAAACDDIANAKMPTVRDMLLLEFCDR